MFYNFAQKKVMIKEVIEYYIDRSTSTYIGGRVHNDVSVAKKRYLDMKHLCRKETKLAYEKYLEHNLNTTKRGVFRLLFAGFLHSSIHTVYSILLLFLLFVAQEDHRYGGEIDVGMNYKEVLDGCRLKLVKDLQHPDILVDALYETLSFDITKLRDIEEEDTTTAKNRAIVKLIRSSSAENYRKFLDCLRKSHQGHIADHLVNMEKELGHQKSGMADTVTEVETDQQSASLMFHSTTDCGNRGNEANGRTSSEEGTNPVMAHIYNQLGSIEDNENLEQATRDDSVEKVGCRSNGIENGLGNLKLDGKPEIPGSSHCRGEDSDLQLKVKTSEEKKQIEPSPVKTRPRGRRNKNLKLGRNMPQTDHSLSSSNVKSSKENSQEVQSHQKMNEPPPIPPLIDREVSHVECDAPSAPNNKLDQTSIDLNVNNSTLEMELEYGTTETDARFSAPPTQEHINKASTNQNSGEDSNLQDSNLTANSRPNRQPSSPREIPCTSPHCGYIWSNKDVEDKHLNTIASRIGEDWETVAMQLGLKKERIDQIKEEHPQGAVLRRTVMLKDALKVCCVKTLRPLGKLLNQDTLKWHINLDDLNKKYGKKDCQCNVQDKTLDSSVNTASLQHTTQVPLSGKRDFVILNTDKDEQVAQEVYKHLEHICNQDQTIQPQIQIDLFSQIGAGSTDFASLGTLHKSYRLILIVDTENLESEDKARFLKDIIIDFGLTSKSENRKRVVPVFAGKTRRDLVLRPLKGFEYYKYQNQQTDKEGYEEYVRKTVRTHRERI